MKLEVLFPEISGLYGDAANREVLLHALPDTEVLVTPLEARPVFSYGGADFVLLGSMTERSQELAIASLMPYAGDINEQIDAGTVFLVTGNAIELFGKYIENDDGSRIDALGLFDFHAQRRMLNRHNSMFLGKLGVLDIVGFNSRFSHMYGGCPDNGLFTVERGTGRKPGDTVEGVRRNNFMATYLLGPLLVLNPPFLKYVLKLTGAEPDLEIPFETAAMTAYEKRLREFRDPQTVEMF